MMKKHLETVREALIAWTLRHAEGPKAKWWLFGIAFIESSFFPIPPDVLLAAILMTRERVRAFFYATVTIVGSVLGALLGYAIGYFFYQTVGAWIINVYHLQTEMVAVQTAFADNAFLAIFIAAFTPIPYKVFTIAAGIFSINLPTLIIASILGRGARFFTVAAIMKYFGEHIAHTFYKYFDILSLVVVVLIAFLLYIFLP